MAEPSFQRIQHAFAAHIRDPDNNPAPPGVRPERMAMYRELFFNNVRSFIGNGFPVLREVLDEAHWLALVQDFFARHRSQTPYFSNFPEEFLAFLREERNHPEDPPFLLELAHYEWVELALSLAEGEAPAASPQLQQDPLACMIALSELAWPLAYHFPVQRIGKSFQPAEAPAQPTLLAVYRNREDVVRFLELSPASFRLLQIVDEDGPMPAQECLLRIADELGAADPAAVFAQGGETLRGLGLRGIIGGS